MLKARSIGLAGLGTGIAMTLAVLNPLPAAAGVGWGNYAGSGLSFTNPTGYYTSPQSQALTVGQTVSMTMTSMVTNTTNAPVTVPLYYSVWKITTCVYDNGPDQKKAYMVQVCDRATGLNNPSSVDVSDGTPNASLQNAVQESEFMHGWEGTVQYQVYPTTDLNHPVVPNPQGVPCSTDGTPNAVPACMLTVYPGTPYAVSFTAPVSQVGYYQLDVGNSAYGCTPNGGPPNDAGPLQCQPNSTWGLAFGGFSRVLAALDQPSPSPSPSPTSSPTLPVTGGVQGTQTSGPPNGGVGGGAPAGISVPNTGADLSVTGLVLVALGGGALLASRRPRWATAWLRKFRR